jgi:hypothetical protein
VIPYRKYAESCTNDFIFNVRTQVMHRVTIQGSQPYYDPAPRDEGGAVNAVHDAHLFCMENPE